ncbi:MAG TPA: hypothetical protein VHL78_07200 [Actinomycetota bacterium]|nr:hypothetical protein [Actinomycetota bacterium]
MDERNLLRLGGFSAILGAVVALVANLVHPRISDFADRVRGELQMVAASGAWIPIHLAALAGTLLILFGLYAVVRSLKGGPAEPVARLALGLLLIATPLAIVLLAVDGYSTKSVADAWAGATGPARDLAFAAATAVADIAWAMFMAFLLTVLGLAPIALGWAIAASRSYPAALGWPAAVLGAIAVVAAVLGILTGPSAAFFIVFVGASGLLTIWVLALGVVLTRRTAAGAPAPTPAAA